MGVGGPLGAVAPGRINNSNIVSELVFSLSNILVLYNDRIIHKASHLGDVTFGEQLKIWLTVLEYSEVFIEISSRKLWGERSRWVIVVCLQIFKCIARLLLVFQHKVGIIQNPPVTPLKRQSASDVQLQDERRVQWQSATFTLKKSGRVIRRVEMAPPIQGRLWKPLLKLNLPEEEGAPNNQALSTLHTFSETLYVVKPLLHLGSMYYCGQKDWKPWLLSLAADLTSIQLHRGNLSQRQRLELSRRTIALLLYLLRSPFFDKYTKRHLLRLLNTLSKHVPLMGLVLTPLAQYLPMWQDTYFYMWST
uniref:Peroxisomal membrane protein PEX16 n=1 Tax=Timema tahoe TaxID=61484 RepID=A0A7R9IAZ6_9NEOP|nr:unnamed protein product [Timema tahoe]